MQFIKLWQRLVASQKSSSSLSCGRRNRTRLEVEDLEERRAPAGLVLDLNDKLCQNSSVVDTVDARVNSDNVGGWSNDWISDGNGQDGQSIFAGRTIRLRIAVANNQSKSNDNNHDTQVDWTIGAIGNIGDSTSSIPRSTTPIFRAAEQDDPMSALDSPYQGKRSNGGYVPT